VLGKNFFFTPGQPRSVICRELIFVARGLSGGLRFVRRSSQTFLGGFEDLLTIATGERSRPLPHGIRFWLSAPDLTPHSFAYRDSLDGVETCFFPPPPFPFSPSSFGGHAVEERILVFLPAMKVFPATVRVYPRLPSVHAMGTQ